MPAATVFRIIAGILLIPAAAAAGYFAAGLVTTQAADTASLEQLRDTVMPNERGLEIPTIQGTLTIRGMVQQPSGQPIANAKVRLAAGFYHKEVETNDLGRFAIDRVPQGSLSVVAYAPGFRPGLYSSPDVPTREIVIKLDANAEFHAIAPDSGWKQGSLQVDVEPESLQKQLPTLTLVAMPKGSDAREGTLLPRSLPLNVEIDNVNRRSIAFDPLPTGNYVVFAVPYGASPDVRRALAKTEARIEEGKRASVRLSIATGSVRGIVTTGGREVTNAQVRIYKKSDPGTDGVALVTNEVELARAQTASDGEFTVSGLPATDVRIEVLVAGHELWSATVRAEQTPQLLRIALAPEK
jgi:hypothetical protein